MANKYDLKTVNVALTGGDENVGEEAVAADRKIPAGKTRYVCFVKVSPGANANIVTIGKGTNAAMVTVKDTTSHAANAILAYPDVIDVDNPLMGVSSVDPTGLGVDQYLVIGSTDATGTATIVYYDE